MDSSAEFLKIPYRYSFRKRQVYLESEIMVPGNFSGRPIIGKEFGKIDLLNRIKLLYQLQFGII